MAEFENNNQSNEGSKPIKITFGGKEYTLHVPGNIVFETPPSKSGLGELIGDYETNNYVEPKPYIPPLIKNEPITSILTPDKLASLQAGLGIAQGDKSLNTEEPEEFPAGPAEEAPLKYPLPNGVRYAGAIGAKELVEGIIPQQDGLNLTDATIHYFAVDDQEGGTEFIGFVDYDLRGLRLNRLLYAIAPNKIFGLDTSDIVMDWTDIDTDPARLRRHQGMGEGWNIFMRERDFLLERIKEGRNEATAPKRGVVPVIRWKVNANGEKNWLFDHFEGEPYTTLTQSYLSGAAAKTETSDTAWLNPLVGLYIVAHFSPDVTGVWPQNRGYTDSATGSQNAMGPTQVVALATIKRDAFLGSKFIEKSEAFIRASIAA